MANAASGMAVHDDCKLKFLELKAKRTFRTIVYKIEDKQVIVEKLGEPEHHTMTLHKVFRKTNADMPFMISTLSLRRTAKRARFSSSHGKNVY
ncbi:unnamed protein product [Eruca vesicaria subsp. sativa]|uniref:ADF-H domain-containing protein n=1 Tax=Eruca vesicaria subsp. sativa TaxID=29727 RepID=A0ABC8LB64_ERUVS|nr:unnamed protein product [Eruca vesicaria subsp. sativa]